MGQGLRGSEQASGIDEPVAQPLRWAAIDDQLDAIRRARPQDHGQLRESRPRAGTRGERAIVLDFALPATLLMRSGARPAGAAAGSTGEGVEFHSCQALTPETAESTHYFFMEAHRADRGDAATTHGLYEGLLEAFREDREMIVAQACNLRTNAERPMLALHMDEALVRFRRLVLQRLADEANGTS